MGSFEPVTRNGGDGRVRSRRTALSAAVGENAPNRSRDLRIVVRTLSAAGLLPEDTKPEQAEAVVAALLRKTGSGAPMSRQTPQLPAVEPGGDIERAFRRALSAGRFPLAHRVLAAGAASGPRHYLAGGMRRALARLTDDNHGAADEDTPWRHRRARLPRVSGKTFQANRRLADSLAAGHRVPGLEQVIFEAVADGGKQGFAEVRDFLDALRERAPRQRASLMKRVKPFSTAKAARRWAALRRGTAPAEADFDD